MLAEFRASLRQWKSLGVTVELVRPCNLCVEERDECNVCLICLSVSVDVYVLYTGFELLSRSSSLSVSSCK